MGQLEGHQFRVRREMTSGSDTALLEFRKSYLKVCDFTLGMQVQQGKYGEDSMVNNDLTSRVKGMSLKFRRRMFFGGKGCPYMRKHGPWDQHVETRHVGKIISDLMSSKDFPFLRREQSTQRSSEVGGKPSSLKFADSDYIIKLKNITHNMNVDDTLTRSRRQLSCVEARKHVFFWKPLKILTWIAYIMDNYSRTFKNEVNSLDTWGKVIGEGNANWQYRLCPKMKAFVDNEIKRAREKKSQDGSGSNIPSSASKGASLSGVLKSTKMNKSYQYDVTSLYDLLKLIRHTSVHLLEIDREVEKIAYVLGLDAESFLRYFTLRYPSLVTVIWVISCQQKNYPFKYDFSFISDNSNYPELGSEAAI